MADTTFVSGTVVTSAWLNDVNFGTYNPTSASVFEYMTKAEITDVKNRTALIDVGPKIDLAITAAAARGAGRLLFPAGRYKRTTAMPMSPVVDIVGAGILASVIECHGCGGATWSYLSSFQNSRVSNIGFEGVGNTTQIGLYQPGTTNSADQLYGITIDNVGIRGFNVGIQFRNVFNVTIDNVWIQDVNSGINLIGQCLVVNIRTPKIVYAAGCGSGTQNAILCQQYTFATGGSIRPENVTITDGGNIYGFTNGVNFDGVFYGILTDTAIQALGSGVLFSSAQALTIKNNYIEIAGAAALYGIYGLPQASLLASKIRITGNSLVNTNNAAGTTVGVRLGDGTNGNQDGVIVSDNDFTGFTKYDIYCYASGNNQFKRNECLSSAVTASIFTQTIPANRLLYIDENHCASTIVYDAADATSGNLQLGTNIISGSVVDFGSSNFQTPAYNSGNYTGIGAMTWGVDSGDIRTAAFAIRGKHMLYSTNLTTTSVGGTLNSQLLITIPGSKVATKRMNSICFIIDNGVRTTGYLEVLAGGTTISVNRTDGTNFTAAANTTSVFGEIEFEIT